MSLLACAICVCAENAGRYRGGCMKHGQDERSGLQFGRGLFGSRSMSAKQPNPLCPGLVSPHRGLCWYFWPSSSLCLCLPKVAETRWRCFPSSNFHLPLLSLQLGGLSAGCPP